MGVVKGEEGGVCESFRAGEVGGKGVEEGWEEMRKRVKEILERDNRGGKRRTNGRW